MSTSSRIWLSLAAFLVTAGVVYGFTSHELAGTSFLLVCGITFCFLGLVARSVARRFPESGDVRADEEVYVAPTIWPLGFSVAALILMLGVVIGLWFLVLGVIVFALASAGWLREVRREHPHPPDA